MKHWPESQGSEPLPTPGDMARAGLCVGCGSCAERMRWDKNGFLKPEASSVPPASFAQQCPFSPAAADEDAISAERFAGASSVDPRIGCFEGAYVGYVAEPSFRPNGSSGGITSWVAAELLRTGRVDGVAHVAPTDPASGRTSLIALRDRWRRSIGVPSRAIIRSSCRKSCTRSAATPGRYAVVGMPCFIKAIHLLRRADPVLASGSSHTLGLFCGHMKSARLVESFAWQLRRRASPRSGAGVPRKGRQAARQLVPHAALDLDDGSSAEQDWWHIADGDWGAGFFQNPACDCVRRRGGRDRRHLLRRRLGGTVFVRRARHKCGRSSARRN